MHTARSWLPLGFKGGYEIQRWRGVGGPAPEGAGIDRKTSQGQKNTRDREQLGWVVVSNIIESSGKVYLKGVRAVI